MKRIYDSDTMDPNEEEGSVEFEGHTSLSKDLLNLDMNYLSNDAPASRYPVFQEPQFKRGSEDVENAYETEFDAEYASAARELDDWSIEIKDDNKVSESIMNNFTLYEISVVNSKRAFSSIVQRRFSDFEWLYEELCNTYPFLIIPLPPEKNILTKINLESEIFKRERTRSLNNFIKKIISHRILCNSEKLQAFFRESRQQFEKLCKNASESNEQKTIYEKGQKVIGSMGSYLSAAVSNLSTISNSILGKKTEEKREMSQDDKRFEELEKFLNVFGTRLEETLNCVQQINGKNADQARNMHEMSVIFSSVGRESRLLEQTANKLSTNLEEMRKLQEDHNRFIADEFEFQLKELIRDIYAAKEALRRRKEIVKAIEKSSEFIALNLRDYAGCEYERRKIKENQELLQKTNLILAKEFEIFKSSIVQDVDKVFSSFKLKQDNYNRSALNLWSARVESKRKVSIDYLK
eukprot:TRINITY_DN9771_c0_g1_i2.p1 TRINITY_DN9771_c0_g1~~TRINITY_DN9771_c0_g1_i2.p1  ORF type:complete len:465 (-),score=142.66 TRINITY_DN9771_c0_g1_i2:275-1669(-)